MLPRLPGRKAGSGISAAVAAGSARVEASSEAVPHAAGFTRHLRARLRRMRPGGQHEDRPFTIPFAGGRLTFPMLDQAQRRLPAGAA